MSTVSQPPFLFVLVFLLFSGLFFYNSYQLWFKTDAYYSELLDSLTRSSFYPFRDFFLKLMQNRRRWELFQKAFSVVGLIAVLAADMLVLNAWMAGN